MQGISHVAIGVRDMDKSLPFYRDLLGLRVTLDTIEDAGGLPALFRDPQKGKRRAVYLRWENGPDASFLVLSAPVGPPSGEPIKLDEVGIHHFSFWVKDLRTKLEKLQAAGVPILVRALTSDTVAYGEAPGGKVLTCLFQDPDGIILQFDERIK
jgi:catechol 2,3-dioxygenase-like lactoylglutathione lyase family enzyme